MGAPFWIGKELADLGTEHRREGLLCLSCRVLCVIKIITIIALRVWSRKGQRVLIGIVFTIRKLSATLGKHTLNLTTPFNPIGPTTSGEVAITTKGGSFVPGSGWQEHFCVEPHLPSMLCSQIQTSSSGSTILRNCLRIKSSLNNIFHSGATTFHPFGKDILQMHIQFTPCFILIHFQWTEPLYIGVRCDLIFSLNCFFDPFIVIEISPSFFWPLTESSEPFKRVVR